MDRDVQNFHTTVMAWMVEMESAMTRANLMEDLNNRCVLFIQVSKNLKIYLTGSKKKPWGQLCLPETVVKVIIANLAWKHTLWYSDVIWLNSEKGRITGCSLQKKHFNWPIWCYVHSTMKYMMTLQNLFAYYWYIYLQLSVFM